MCYVDSVSLLVGPPFDESRSQRDGFEVRKAYIYAVYMWLVGRVLTAAAVFIVLLAVVVVVAVLWAC